MAERPLAQRLVILSIDAGDQRLKLLVSLKKVCVMSSNASEPMGAEESEAASECLCTEMPEMAYLWPILEFISPEPPTQ